MILGFSTLASSSSGNCYYIKSETTSILVDVGISASQIVKRLDALEAIRFIKSLGAVAVLAHPLLSLTERELRPFLEEAKPAGLDGMEVYYSTYSPEETALAIRIAGEYSLAHSGGSDFHGGNKPDIQLGSGKGNLCICDNLLKNLANL